MRKARAALAVLLLLLAACAAPTPTGPAPAATDVTPSAAAAESRAGFTGVWHTTYGSMRLSQTGAHVTGSYAYADGSRIEGDVQGRELHALYTEPGGVAGRALFTLQPDGAAFHGLWRPDPERPLLPADADAQSWDGTRVEAVPGRVWLVILEAPWEESLDEPPYSYGDMLHSFFARVPDVEVRHLLFHDKADFVRACHEVGQLVGPVVLYVSSHGSREGLNAGPDTIDGRTIGEALRDAGDLRLLHLGSCELLAGDAAAEIRAAAAPHAAFPISGFTVAVDWAGSAIVDFTYMSLVLEGGMDPVEAVRATRSMVSFAGEGREGDEIPGADLIISPP